MPHLFSILFLKSNKGFRKVCETMTLVNVATILEYNSIISLKWQKWKKAYFCNIRFLKEEKISDNQVKIALAIIFN